MRRDGIGIVANRAVKQPQVAVRFGNTEQIAVFLAQGERQFGIADRTLVRAGLAVEIRHRVINCAKQRAPIVLRDIQRAEEIGLGALLTLVCVAWVLDVPQRLGVAQAA